MAYVQHASPFKKLKKTTKGKGRHFLSAKEGAGMTSGGPLGERPGQWRAPGEGRKLFEILGAPLIGSRHRGTDEPGTQKCPKRPGHLRSRKAFSLPGSSVHG